MSRYLVVDFDTRMIIGDHYADSPDDAAAEHPGVFVQIYRISENAKIHAAQSRIDEVTGVELQLVKSN